MSMYKTMCREKGHLRIEIKKKKETDWGFLPLITTRFSPSVIVLPVDKALSTSLLLTFEDPRDVASLGRGSSAMSRDESGESEDAGAAVSEFLTGTFARQN